MIGFCFASTCLWPLEAASAISPQAFSAQSGGNMSTGRRTVVDGKIKSRHTANAALKQAGLPKSF
ncbi:MAG: hypothetical protein ACHQAY_23930 [Hyphomicrobiales bacterium]